MNIIEKNIDNLLKLCKKYKVSKLYVFGSSITKNFNQKSDVDLLVTFNDVDLKHYADNYFDFKFSLEKVFNRKVDLIEEKAIKNPFFKKSIDKTKKIIYG